MRTLRRAVSVASALALSLSLVPMSAPVAVAAVPDGTLQYQAVVPAQYDWAPSIAQSVAYDSTNDEIYILDTGGGSIVRYNATTGARLSVTTSVASFAIPADGSGGDLEAIPGGVRFLSPSRTDLLELSRTGTSSVLSVASPLDHGKAFAADTANSIWVADGVFPAERIRNIGVGGGGPTATVSPDVLFPHDVADFGTGVFVADGNAGAGRVRRMTAAGVVQSTWSTTGPTASGVAVCNDTTVVVADSSGNQLVTFDTSLSPAGKFGSSGFGDGQLNYPTFLTSVPASDGVWVTDRNNARADLFGTGGAFRRKVGTGPRADNGYFANPADLDVDAAGNVYVLDRNNGRVQVLDSNGTYLRSTPATAGLNTGSANALCVGPDGKIYVADGNGGRVVVFANDCTYLGSFNAGLASVRDVAVGGDGRIYVADAVNGLRIYDASTWTLVESRASSAIRLASNEYGYVFIADGSNYTKIAPDGSQQNLGTPPSGANFDVDLAGNTYDVGTFGVTVRDYLNSRTLTTIGSAGNGTSQFRGARAAAVTRDGYVWVADGVLNRIQKFRYYDRTAPTSQIDVGAGWRTTPVAPVTLEATDPLPGTGVAAIWTSVDGAPAQIHGGIPSNPYAGNWSVDVAGEGTHTIEVRALDGYSNSEASHTANVRIDSVPPSVTISADWPADGSWISHNMTVTVSIEDTTSGVGTVNGPSGGWSEVTPGQWVYSTENVATSFDAIDAYDVAGNQNYKLGSLATFRVDKTPPTTNANVPANLAAPCDVQLVPSDGGGSGIATMYWSVDGSAAETASGTSIVTLPTAATHTIEYRSVDNVGNSEATKSVDVVVTDGGGGSGTFSIDGFTPSLNPGGWTNRTETTLTVPGRGLAQMRVRYDTDSWSAWYPWAEETTIPVPLAEGTHTLHAEFCNGSHDATDTRNTDIKVDRTKPHTTCNIPDGSAQPDPVDVTFVGNDDGTLPSGVDFPYFVVDGGSAVHGGSVDVSGNGTHTVEFWSIDNAGNEETHNHTTFTIGAEPVHTWERSLPANNRWQVAVSLAKKAFPGWKKPGGGNVDTVIIACGSDAKAADPLGAAGLVGAIEAPLLLVQNDAVVRVNNETKNALSNLVSTTGAKPEIIVIGGTGTITSAHIAVLKAYDKNGLVQRIGGANRYEVAANIAYEMKKRNGGVNPARVFVASGLNTRFFDPLAAGAVAAASGCPVLLTNGADGPRATVSAVASLAPDASDRFLVAHTSVVSAAAAKTLGVPVGNRIAGSDASRQRTAAAVAQWGLEKGIIGTTQVGLTNKLADALGGSGAMGVLRGGILYTADNATLGTPSSSWLHANGTFTQTVYLIGGSGSIPDATGNSAVSACP